MSQLVRYKKGKKVFEVLTKPGSVRKYRIGKLGWDNVLVSDQIFTNSKKANLAKGTDLIDVFGTNDTQSILQTIVKEGDLQISASERKEDAEEHRKKIIGYMHRTYVDAKGLPHPVTRLKEVLREAKVRLNPLGNHEKQAEEIIKKMQGKLVFKKSCVEYTIFLVHKYARKCQGIIYKYCKISRESWDRDGCLWLLTLSPGDFDSFMKDLNKITGGDYLLNIGRKDPREKKPKDEEEKSKPCKRKQKRNRRNKKMNFV